METEIKDKTGSYRFTVLPFQEDFAGHISWFFLGNHLLRCASLHAGELGFGYEWAQTTGHAWVLSRLVIEMQQMPRTGDVYHIDTWVNRVYRQFTDRPYAILGQDGRVFGYASSIWSLIDIRTRRPIDLERDADSRFLASAAPELTVPVKPPGRVRVKANAPARTVPTYYSDIDINGHVNSIRYIEHILDLLPKELYADHFVRRIELAYCAETLCGEQLAFYVDPVSELAWNIEVRKNDATPVVRAALILA